MKQPTFTDDFKMGFIIGGLFVGSLCFAIVLAPFL